MRKFLTTMFMICSIMTTTVSAQQYIGEMNLDGTNQRLIYSHFGQAVTPHWSSDMQNITFGSSSSTTGMSEIFAYSLNQKILCQLTN